MKLTISPRGLPPRPPLTGQVRITPRTGGHDAPIAPITTACGKTSRPMALVWRRVPRMQMAPSPRGTPATTSNHLHLHTHVHSHLALHLATHHHALKNTPHRLDPRSIAPQADPGRGLLRRIRDRKAPAAQASPCIRIPARLPRAAQPIGRSETLPGNYRPDQGKPPGMALAPLLQARLAPGEALLPTRPLASPRPALANQSTFRAHPLVLSRYRPALRARRGLLPPMLAPSAPLTPANSTQWPNFRSTGQPVNQSPRPFRARNANRHPTDRLIHGSPRGTPHPTVRSTGPHAVVERVWRTERATPPAPEHLESGASRAITATDSAPTVPSRSAPGPHPLTPSQPQASGRPPISTPFDRSLMERLTDEVARNIEKRLRIERERRGL